MISRIPTKIVGIATTIQLQNNRKTAKIKEFSAISEHSLD